MRTRVTPWFLVGWLALALGDDVRRRAQDELPAAAAREAEGLRAREAELDAARMSARALRRLPGVGDTRARAVAEARWSGRSRGAPLPESFSWSAVHGVGPLTEEKVRAWFAARGGDATLRTRVASARARPPERRVIRATSGRADCDFLMVGRQWRCSSPLRPRDVPMMRFPSPAAAALFAALAVACSHETKDGVASPATPVARAALLVRATDDLAELLSLEVGITELRLVRAGGERTDDLLAGPATLELVGLREGAAWIAASAIPAGDYTAVQLGFAPLALGRALDGTRVAVPVTESAGAFALAVQATVARNELARFVVDVDLRLALRGSLEAGDLRFAPRGTSELVASGRIPLDEIDATVVRRDVATLALGVDAFGDDARTLPLGPALVRVNEGTLLVDRDDFLFDLAPLFYTLFVPGLTTIEIAGSLAADGSVVAERIEVEDQDGRPGATFPVKLQGRIATLSPGFLSLALVDVESGDALVDGFLAGNGDPPTVGIALSLETLVFDGSTVLGLGALAPGADVKVEVRYFFGEPFPADRIELETSAPRIELVIADTSGLPGSVLARVAEGEPALAAGLVASPATEILLTLAGGPLALCGSGKRVVAPQELRPGLALEVLGVPAGTPEAPTLAPEQSRVRAGLLCRARFAGERPAATPEDGVLLSLHGGELVDPFGEPVAPGPVAVLVDERTAFTGAATSLAALRALLGDDEDLRLSVEGLATGVAQEVRALRIDVEGGGG